MGEVTPLKTEVWKHTHTFTSHTFYPTRAVPPAGVTQYDFVHKGQVAEGWEQH